jgi:hypothetical protein
MIEKIVKLFRLDSFHERSNYPVSRVLWISQITSFLPLLYLSSYIFTLFKDPPVHEMLIGYTIVLTLILEICFYIVIKKVFIGVKSSLYKHCTAVWLTFTILVLIRIFPSLYFAILSGDISSFKIEWFHPVLNDIVIPFLFVPLIVSSILDKYYFLGNKEFKRISSITYVLVFFMIFIIIPYIWYKTIMYLVMKKLSLGVMSQEGVLLLITDLARVFLYSIIIISLLLILDLVLANRDKTW